MEEKENVQGASFTGAGMLQGVDGLDGLVELGMQSEQKMGMALRAIKLGVSSALCQSVSRLHSMSTESLGLMNKLDARYNSLLEEELETLNRQECAGEFAMLQSRVMQVAALEAKLVQGRDIFPEDTFSPEDRKVLRLFSSLGNSAQKSKVLSILERELGKVESFGEPEDGTDDCLSPEDATDECCSSESYAAPAVTKGGRLQSKLSKLTKAGATRSTDTMKDYTPEPVSKRSSDEAVPVAATPVSSEFDDFEGM